jgi:2-polyprenyl-3-methyl-5-hydroxy-6-metoxy-1,4-benzoquinol methylase
VGVSYTRKKGDVGVFHNYINIYDFLDVFMRIRQGRVRSILAKFAGAGKGRVAESWSHTQSRMANWWDIPMVRRRWNELISGDPRVDHYEYVSRNYLAGVDGLRGLSLGCGTGERELRWAKLGHFELIDAVDLSETRIAYAREQAKDNGYSDILRYQVCDVAGMEAPAERYDVIIVEQSLHHFSPLREILERVDSMLADDGLFILDEYVGPTRFQWTARQLELANALLKILPVEYRRIVGTKMIKRNVHRPGKLRMILSDPSEAVESGRIRPLLRELFAVVEEREYGGTLLQLLLADIAKNFVGDTQEDQRLLNLCFDVEDTFLKTGEIESNFCFFVCRKKTNPGPTTSLTPDRQ